MASLIVNRGLQILVGRLGNTADAFTELLSLTADDSTVAFATTDTALNSGGAVSNFAVVAFDATPTRSGQVLTCIGTFGTGVANWTHRRAALHNLASGSVTASSTSLFGGRDGIGPLTKDNTMSFEYTFTVTLTDNS